MKLSRLKIMALALLGAATLLGGTTIPRPAHATITITPMFLVIEGRNRYADLNLINTSDKQQTYDIGWRFFSMEEGTGQYIVTDKPTTDFDVTKNMVFTPKRVTLEPRETQKVRLALRLQGEPPAPGDYRGHLEFSQVPTAGPPERTATEPDNSSEKKEVKVGVGVSVAFSVPIVYRVGEPDATATMGEVATFVNPNSGQLEVRVPIARQGTTSLMGELTAYHTPKGGTRTMVGQVKNANIFPEVSNRTFEFPLTVKSLTDGTLDIVYKEADLRKKTVFAERSIVISP